MFGKLFTTSSVILALSVQVYGHAAISPALGVNGGIPTRDDVKAPSNNNPCGNNINIAATIDSSQAVSIKDGSITVSSINFNGGGDGSRQVSAKLDATGKGDTFNTDLTVTKNGDPAPNQEKGQDSVTISIPANTKCTGGKDGNKCLVQFKTTAGFGNCVVAQQDAPAAAANTNAGGAKANTDAAGTANSGGAKAGGDSNADATADAKTGTGAAAGTDVKAGSGADTKADAGADTKADAKADAGADAKAGSGAAAKEGSGASADAGTGEKNTAGDANANAVGGAAANANASANTADATAGDNANTADKAAATTDDKAAADANKAVGTGTGTDAATADTAVGAAAGAAVGAAAGAGAATAAVNAKAKGNGKKGGKKNKKNKMKGTRPVGTRAARAVLAGIDIRNYEAPEVLPRSWSWAKDTN